MKKRYAIAFTAAFMALTCASPVYANEWKSDVNGWWYEYNNGSYPKNQWENINNQWYYFGGNGYMYSNSITPDGYVVAPGGEMIVPGKDYMNILNSGKDVTICGNEYNTTELIDHGAYYELTNVILETPRLYDINLSAYNNGDAIVVDGKTFYIRDMNEDHTYCSLYAAPYNGFPYCDGFLSSVDGKHCYRIEKDDDNVFQDTLYQGSVYCSKECIVNELPWDNDHNISEQPVPSSIKEHYSNNSGNAYKYYTSGYLLGTLQIDKNGLITQINQIFSV